VEIRGLRWRPANRDKLREHGISVDEVDWIVDNGDWVSYVDGEYPEQARMVGVTGTGRHITVVLAPTRDPAQWRPITGWDATPREREYYRENH
jgi:uncharacterized DUF497 family protein